MRHSAVRLVSLPLLLLTISAAFAATGSGSQAFTADDLVRLKRLSDPQVAPDGQRVAFLVRETDMEADHGRTHVWLLDLSTKDRTPRQLTRDPAGESNPRWAPDGGMLYFLSARSGSSQVWRISLRGGEAQQVTDFPLDVGTLQVAPAGNRLAVTMAVFPECADLKCTAERLQRREKEKATGVVYDQLFIRHWDQWEDGTLSTLFTTVVGADGRAGEAVNVSGKVRAHVPSRPSGGDEEFTFSPDGRRLVFSARLADRVEAWSTNFDLYEVASDGSSPPANLTADNPAWDTQPVFLADGDLAWLAQERPGFESDRFHVVLRDARTGSVRPLTQEWDRSVGRLRAARDGRGLLATADDVGQTSLFSVDPRSGKVAKLVGEGQVAEFSPAADGIVVAWNSLGAPTDLYLARRAGATPGRLTSVNADLLGLRALSAYEQFSFAGWNGETVYGYAMQPFGLSPGRKYPIAFIVHGGPQVSLQNQWNYRWNPQVFAGHGYGVVFIDFHGSPGYGQAFTDSISRDWGGKPLVDLQKGLAAAVARFDWLDGERACSLGPSYGGFMQNWIAGNWPERFRCIVNHAGIFDQRTMYYATEELWFPEWEHGGPYYENPEGHEKFNPANFVKNWRTPMLVITGEHDYRVPYTQGLSTFTALQRRGIPSRLLYFPDEGHWILKPADSLQWHKVVLEWLDTYLR